MSDRLLGQMDNVLDVSFPTPVPELLEFIGFLFLDLRKFIKLDCVRQSSAFCCLCSINLTSSVWMCVRPRALITVGCRWFLREADHQRYCDALRSFRPLCSYVLQSTTHDRRRHSRWRFRRVRVSDGERSVQATYLLRHLLAL